MNKDKLKKAITDFLNEQVIAAVATVSHDNIPDVATMYYCIDDDLNFYLMTAKSSHKLKNIESNKNIAVAVGFGPATITVQAQGEVEVLYQYNDNFINKVFSKIKFHNIDQLPALTLEKDGVVFLKFKPKHLAFLNLDKSNHPDSYNHEQNTLTL